MDKFTLHDGLVVPLERVNVDTDAIIPKQFLKSIQRTGFGPNLFDEWRYLDHGEPGMDCGSRPLNMEFILNQERYQGASILVAGNNFGCGSSREHAPWALQQYGFKAVIAPSFADIFFNNCFKIGLLPISLPEEQVTELFGKIKATEGYRLVVDLENLVLRAQNGDTYAFSIDPFRQYCLLNGLDDIGLTLRRAEEIRAFESRRIAEQPWLANTI